MNSTVVNSVGKFQLFLITSHATKGFLFKLNSFFNIIQYSFGYCLKNYLSDTTDSQLNRTCSLELSFD